MTPYEDFCKRVDDAAAARNFEALKALFAPAKPGGAQTQDSGDNRPPPTPNV